MATSPQSIAWTSRWRGVRPNAEYHEDFGLERTWREHFEEWGYPMEDFEQDTTFEGKPVKGRTFSTIGMVVWTPGGHKVVGW